MSDLDPLVPAIVAGDAAAFGRWVAGAEPRVRGSLRSFATVVDTEAVLQEALLRTWQFAPRFEPDGRPDGLLRLTITIARNLAIRETERRRPDLVESAVLERFAEESQAAPPPSDPLLRDLIGACLEALPAQPRAALRQRLGARGNTPDRTLATAIGMRLNTFLQNIRRARIGLQRCLERQGVHLSAEGAP